MRQPGVQIWKFDIDLQTTKIWMIQILFGEMISNKWNPTSNTAMIQYCLINILW